MKSKITSTALVRSVEAEYVTNILCLNRKRKGSISANKTVHEMTNVNILEKKKSKFQLVYYSFLWTHFKQAICHQTTGLSL